MGCGARNLWAQSLESFDVSRPAVHRPSSVVRPASPLAAVTITRQPNDGQYDGAEPMLPAQAADARRKAEEEEFDRVYLSLHRQLTRYARFRTGTKQDAEDVLQKVWQKAHLEKTIALCGGELPRIAAYLRKMIYNQVIEDAKHERSVKARAKRYWRSLKTSVSERESPDRHALERDIDWHFANEISKLPARCREAFILVAVLHKTYKEAAKELGIDVTTVAVHLRTAKRLLKLGLAAVGYYAPPELEDEGKEQSL